MARKDNGLNGLPLTDNASGSGLVVVTLAMLAIGIVAVHSALAGVKPSTVEWWMRSDMRHTLFAAAAALVMCFGWHFRYRWLCGDTDKWPLRAAVVLGFTIVLALMVHFTPLGIARHGKLRWLRIAPSPFGVFQPSEVLKIALLIFLAAWYSRTKTEAKNFGWGFLVSAGVTGVCLLLVVTQDLGSAVIMAVAVLLTMFIAGVRWYALVGLLAAGGGGFWYFVSTSAHRIQRFSAVGNPWSLENPCAYQPRQSLLAILTGGFYGKGLGRGIIKQHHLPERSTDFIFASFSEEWGYLGAMLLVALVVLWIWFARRSASNASDRFGFILAGGLGVLIAIQMVLHIAVDTVAAPPTGMSYPCDSVGGTSLLATAWAASLIVSVSAQSRRQGDLQPSG